MRLRAVTGDDVAFLVDTSEAERLETRPLAKRRPINDCPHRIARKRRPVPMMPLQREPV
jgi:hypothetical protein